MFSRRSLRPVPVLLALVVAGCGSSSDSKGSFVARANTICQGANRDLNVISAQLRTLGQTVHDKQTLYAHAANLTHQAAQRESRAAADLAALTPPGADRSSIDTWLGELRRQASLTELAVSAFNSRNPKGASEAVSQILPIETQAHAFANRYGMTSCGKTTSA